MTAATYAVCNTHFDFAGIIYRVGDVVASNSGIVTRFPTRFDVQVAVVYGSPGTVLTGGTLGTVITGKVPITDSAGTVLGYTAIYNGITGT